jgi:hypothetical protein
MRMLNADGASRSAALVSFVVKQCSDKDDIDLFRVALETSNRFIGFAGAWFDLLSARSTLGYRQDNFGVLCRLPRNQQEI